VISAVRVLGFVGIHSEEGERELLMRGQAMSDLGVSSVGMLLYRTRDRSACVNINDEESAWQMKQERLGEGRRRGRREEGGGRRAFALLRRYGETKQIRSWKRRGKAIALKQRYPRRR